MATHRDIRKITRQGDEEDQIDRVISTSVSGEEV